MVLLTLAACGYVYLFAPRTYEATVSYALTAPDMPSSYALERDENLAKLNSNNPYLRSNDSSLVAQVVIAKLSDPAYVEQLKAAGFATEFKIVPVGSFGMGLLNVSASADSVAVAESTAQFIGEQFTDTLKKVQKVNGADDRYLYSPILIKGPGPAQELFSSRLRAMIMMGIGGGVLLFGAVSGAHSYSLHSRRRRTAATAEGSVAKSDANTVGQQIAPAEPGVPGSSGPEYAEGSSRREADRDQSGPGRDADSGPVPSPAKDQPVRGPEGTLSSSTRLRPRRSNRLAYAGDKPREA